MSRFLSAEWRNLVNITYAVDPPLLKEHVPAGVDLDVMDGSAFVSLVAFDFLNTKLKGIKIPFHVNFPEINLRCYVKHKGQRGVVFIKEFVPKFFIASFAKLIYNEPYQTKPMRSLHRRSGEEIELNYSIKSGGRWHSIQVSIEDHPYNIADTSQEHYFKEHTWGFGVTRPGETRFYRVEHPVWRIYPLQNLELDVDFQELYGDKWSFLNDTQPLLSLVAEGSGVEVFDAQPLNAFI